MRATTLIATLALTGGLIGAGATIAPAFAQNTVPAASATAVAPAAQSSWMSIKDVLDKLEAAGYTDFREIEREKNKYEVKATDPQGQRVELDIDPLSGDILKTEVKRSK
ncbi:PepSY domain-containing protein [Thauera sp. AutoDN2]|jgi:hypothetical protein|uniref:PepSY domain-containing protein n=1 Tax=Thauera sp. AutoDN2 TaxID=3416051 RepID=UPI003F4B2D85